MAGAENPQAADRRAQRTVWWLFAPPALLAALRWLLAWQAERHAPPSAWALTPLPPPGTSALALFLPWLWGLALLLCAGALAVWAVRRLGMPRLRLPLLLAWALLWLLGAVALGVHTANRQGLQAQPPVPAQVLGSRPRPPSARGPGGTELVLGIEGWGAPQQVLVDDPAAATWASGQGLHMQWALGRFYGRYMTGWRTIMAP